jgi:Kef-type K+ transport system membrane component KefB
MTTFELSVQFFLQLAVIVAAAQVIGRLGRYVGQPQVVGEMIAGVLLGPSVLGLLWPDLQAALFPKASMGILFAVSQLGLALYMFLVGVEFRTELLRAHARSAAAVSIAGMAVPFALGCTMAGWLTRQSDLFAPQVQTWQAALFLGAAMSITAFPMLARIIYEHGLAGTSLGTLALAAGAIDDASAWCILAVVLASFGDSWWLALKAIGGGLLYCLAVALIVRPLLRPLGRRCDQQQVLSELMLAVAMVLLMLGAWFTDWIGIYAVFGAFIMGTAMPRGYFAAQLQKMLEPLTVVLLLPLFFTYSGLNTHLDLVDSPRLWLIAAAVLLAACLGKGVACWGAARLRGEPQRSALAIGTLMNARGLMELIILNIGLQQGIITHSLFTIMVIMAIVTTLMASPLFELFYGRWARRQGLLPEIPV